MSPYYSGSSAERQLSMELPTRIVSSTDLMENVVFVSRRYFSSRSAASRRPPPTMRGLA